MKAIEITQYGAPEVLRAGERPDPVAGARGADPRDRERRQPPDVLQRTGNYPAAGRLGHPRPGSGGHHRGRRRPAMAAAGLKAGDRVCALVSGGGYAELCVAPVGQCLPVPRG